jgi:ATP-dependent Clp endopeptidase proteolytic subunit ClpP
VADTTKKASSSLDQLRTAERRLREAELELVNAKTANVKLENGLNAAVNLSRVPYYEFEAAKDDNHRTYNFVDDVNYRSANVAVTVVGAWARLSSAPIVFRFNSPGGSIFDGFALYDQLKAIDTHRAPLTTVCTGLSASMAGILLQAGSHRIVAENANFMVHEASTVAWGKTSDIEDEAKFMRKLNDRLFGILADRSQKAFKAGTAKEGLTLEQVWEKAKRKDWWLDSADAVYFGFADEIGYR